MDQAISRMLGRSVLIALVSILAGCASISERTHAYIGSPVYPRTNPAAVKVFPSEPAQPKDRLGEIVLSIEGNPSRGAVENKLRNGAARLGADAVFVVSDKMRIYPIVYGGWWGPRAVEEDMRRDIVAVAIKLK